MRRYEAAQRAAIPTLPTSFEFYDGLGDRCGAMKKAGTANNRDGKGSSKLKELNIKTTRSSTEC